jgi:hypothetical protein
VRFQVFTVSPTVTLLFTLYRRAKLNLKKVTRSHVSLLTSVSVPNCNNYLITLTLTTTTQRQNNKKQQWIRCTNTRQSWLSHLCGNMPHSIYVKHRTRLTARIRVAGCLPACLPAWLSRQPARTSWYPLWQRGDSVEPLTFVSVKWKTYESYMTWGSPGGDYEDGCLLGCSTV